MLQAERWRARKLPNLQQDGHRIWREVRRGTAGLIAGRR